jgi:hypothetical protein
VWACAGAAVRANVAIAAVTSLEGIPSGIGRLCRRL